ncbi:MAG: hypothetical protein IPN19_04850 [Elusimicrobia bacterium]|nr:hypothetical protein [Elusimicrobiota bacterium]
MVGFSSFLSQLKQPEYVHVLLNHWPVEGLAAGAFALAYALAVKSLAGRRGALLWLALMGVAAWLTILYGHKGYDRVYAMSNADAQAWLDLHAERAVRFQWLFYLTGCSALAALAASWKRPAWEKPLSVLVLALAVMSFAAGGWIAQAGGQVRHSEFRDGPPSVPASHHHDHEE